jgi:hypothetical protein
MLWTTVAQTPAKKYTTSLLRSRKPSEKVKRRAIKYLRKAAQKS